MTDLAMPTSATITPLSAYIQATASYPARYNGLTGATVYAAELAGNEDSPGEFIQGLLQVLADWNTHLGILRASLTPGQIAGGALGYLTASSDAYQAAVSATHKAWVDWSFGLHGDPDDRPAPATPADGCTIPGCDLRFHEEGTCAAEIAELPLGPQGSLNAELVAYEGEGPHLVVFAFDTGSDDTHLRTSDPAEVRAAAARFRVFADALDGAAEQLAQPGDSDPDMDEALRRARAPRTLVGAR